MLILEGKGIVNVEKPPQNESVMFVSDRFSSRGIGIEHDLAVRIVEQSENIPYYLQQLGYFTFESVASDGRDWVEAHDVDAAVAEIVRNCADYFMERMSAFSPTQRSLMTALAREPVADFVESYRRRHGLGVSATVHAALKVLVEAGVVEREERTYRIGDPFFARFVRSSCVEVSSD